MRRLCAAGLVLLSAASGFGFSSAEGTSPAVSSPSPRALELAEKLRSTEMGVDRQGDLWSWHQPAGRLEVVTRQGDLLTTLRLEASQVDFDREWGIVALSLPGDTLLLYAPSGEKRKEIPLDHAGGDVRWISGGRIALSPRTTAYRVEIRDAQEGTLIANWGNEDAIAHRPGFLVVRNVYLVFDFARDRLLTLDSFTGSLVVFGSGGEVLGDASLLHPSRPDIEARLPELDHKLQARGESQETIYLLWDGLGVDPRGRAVTVERCQNQRSIAQLLRFTLPAETTRTTIENLRCCSESLTYWGPGAVFYSDPRQLGVTCNEARRTE